MYGGFEGFEGFEAFDLDVGGAVIHGVRRDGEPGKEPVLLLHGFPQSHVMWHRLAPAVAATGRPVVATDLRGYGDSSRPPGGDDHGGYSFRAMAADQVAAMQALGFGRFALVAHDRGARTAHRMALDHPAAVSLLVLMDILPTAYVYGHVDRRLATAYYHWFFFIQPYDVPERLISADPAFYLRSLLGGWGTGLDRHDQRALAEYERCFADPAARHAMMEDYRAGASIDLRHDGESEAAGRRIEAPTLILWGEAGMVGHNPEDPLSVWRTRAADPERMAGRPVPGAGHFLCEDAPEETAQEVVRFLAGS